MVFRYPFVEFTAFNDIAAQGGAKLQEMLGKNLDCMGVMVGGEGDSFVMCMIQSKTTAFGPQQS